MSDPHIQVEDLTLAYGESVIQRDLNFTVERGDVFIIIGGSGSGKSTVMRCMVGLLEPRAGRVVYAGTSFWEAPMGERERMKRRFGVMYQQGALWSSMTLLENVALPLEEYTELAPAQIHEVAAYKLALVGLAGFEDFVPAEISGGMQKRVGVARAMALDPEILFFDEPSAGLDPLSSKLLDELILGLAENLGTTMVIVTHELASILGIGRHCVFLDNETKTMLTTGNPRQLKDHSEIPKVRAFLNRGEL